MQSTLQYLATLVFCITAFLAHAQMTTLVDRGLAILSFSDKPHSDLDLIVDYAGAERTNMVLPHLMKQNRETFLDYNQNGITFELTDDKAKERILEITSLEDKLIYRIRLPKNILGRQLQIQHLVLENGYYYLNVLVDGSKEKFVFQIDR